MSLRLLTTAAPRPPRATPAERNACPPEARAAEGCTRPVVRGRIFRADLATIWTADGEDEARRRQSAVGGEKRRALRSALRLSCYKGKVNSESIFASAQIKASRDQCASQTPPFHSANTAVECHHGFGRRGLRTAGGECSESGRASLLHGVSASRIVDAAPCGVGEHTCRLKPPWASRHSAWSSEQFGRQHTRAPHHKHGPVCPLHRPTDQHSRPAFRFVRGASTRDA